VKNDNKKRGTSGNSARKKGGMPVDDRVRDGARRFSWVEYPRECEKREPPVLGCEAEDSGIAGTV
jgi:hypothetical protein